VHGQLDAGDTDITEASRVGMAHRFIVARFGQAGPWSTTSRGRKQKVAGK